LSVSLDEFRERTVQIARSDKVWMFSRAWASLGPNLQEFELSVGDATLKLSPDQIRELFVRLTGGSGRRSVSRR
jgi:hypothetical protein